MNPVASLLASPALLATSILNLWGPPLPSAPSADGEPTSARDAVAAPPTSVRSQDGSAELTALRALATDERDLAAETVEPSDRRGLELEWGVELGTANTPTPPSGDSTTPLVPQSFDDEDDEDFDVVDAADRSLTIRRGRRLFWAGFWMSFTGVIFGPGFLAGSVSAAKDEKTTPALVLGAGLAAPCFALLAAGIPLAIRGKRMEKHPERFTIRPTAGGLEVRF